VSECRACQLILDELCRSKGEEQVCEIANAYREGDMSEEQMVAGLKKLVSRADVDQAKRRLVDKGELSAQEAGL